MSFGCDNRFVCTDKVGGVSNNIKYQKKKIHGCPLIFRVGNTAEKISWNTGCSREYSGGSILEYRVFQGSEGNIRLGLENIN